MFKLCGGDKTGGKIYIFISSFLRVMCIICIFVDEIPEYLYVYPEGLSVCNRVGSSSLYSLPKSRINIYLPAFF